MRTRLIVALSSLLASTAFALPALADVLVTVDKGAQRMSVSVDGVPRYDWTVSTGKAGHATPSGSFRANRMERHHFSREWDDAPMPYSIFFTGQGHAIHGTSHVRSLGRAASHGCVRLSVGHAATLFALVRAEGLGNTRVVVRGGDPLVAGRGRGGVRAVRSGPADVVGDDGGYWGGSFSSRTRPAYPAYTAPYGAPYGAGGSGFDDGSY
jgi:hypothetical protein